MDLNYNIVFQLLDLEKKNVEFGKSELTKLMKKYTIDIKTASTEKEVHKKELETLEEEARKQRYSIYHQLLVIKFFFSGLRSWNQRPCMNSIWKKKS